MSLGGDIGYVAALIGGVLALLSPCGALLLPSFFAYAFDRPTQLLSRTGIFYLGLITTLIPLGVTASSLTIFVRTHQETVITVAAITIIVLGVVTALGGGFIMLRSSRSEGDTNPLSVYTLGLAYGLTGFCTGPILGSILVLAAAGGQPVRGGLLLAIYALGMTVPLMILALLWGKLGQGVTKWLRGRTIQIGRFSFHSTSLVSGILLVGVGIFMLVNGGNLVDSPNVALAGARAEEWARDISGKISDEFLALAGLAIAAVWFAIRWRRGESTSSADGSNGGSAGHDLSSDDAGDIALDVPSEA